MERFFGGAAPLLKNLKVIEGFHVSILCDIGKSRIGHTQLFSLVNIGSPTQKMRSDGKQLAGHFPVVLGIAKARIRTRLIVIGPEQRIPATTCRNLFLPRFQQLAKLADVRLFERPLVPVEVINLEVMKRESHGKLMVSRIGISDAVFN